jgi:hypothetical protein
MVKITRKSIWGAESEEWLVDNIVFLNRTSRKDPRIGITLILVIWENYIILPKDGQYDIITGMSF